MRRGSLTFAASLSAIGLAGCGGLGLSVRGSMSRDRTDLVRTDPGGGSEESCSLRVSAMQGEVALSCGSWGTLRAGGGVLYFRSQGHGGTTKTAWSAAAEVRLGARSGTGRYVALAASHFDAPEYADEIESIGIWHHEIRRSAARVVVGRRFTSGRAFVGMRFSEVLFRTGWDPDVGEYGQDSGPGAVLGFEGERGKCTTFLEAGFLDSTGLSIGMSWRL